MLDENFQTANPYYALAYHMKADGDGEFLEKKEIWTGIGIYDGILQHLDKIPNKYWIMLIDVHRLIRYAISLVLFEEEYIKGFLEIEKELMIVMNLGLKVHISGDVEIIKRMEFKLRKLKEKEYLCIFKVLQQLREYQKFCKGEL